jgi:hypothetical protein
VADDALDQVMRALAAVPAVEGTFREEKTLAILQEPLVATGLLYYRAPAFLRKRTLSPQPEDYEADGDWLTVETPAAGRRQFDLNGYPATAALRGSDSRHASRRPGDVGALLPLEFQGTCRRLESAPDPARVGSRRVCDRDRPAWPRGWIDSVETLEPTATAA